MATEARGVLSLLDGRRDGDRVRVFPRALTKRVGCLNLQTTMIVSGYKSTSEQRKRKNEAQATGRIADDRSGPLMNERIERDKWYVTVNCSYCGEVIPISKAPSPA
jgi:hypothetical protein